MSNRFLQIYMNDQLAAGVLWREVARRSARNNRGTDVGRALSDVATGIAEDVVTFEQKILWQNLRDCAGLSNRLPDIDFDALIERAADSARRWNPSGTQRAQPRSRTRRPAEDRRAAPPTSRSLSVGGSATVLRRTSRTKLGPAVEPGLRNRQDSQQSDHGYAVGSYGLGVSVPRAPFTPP